MDGQLVVGGHFVEIADDALGQLRLSQRGPQ